MDIRTKFRLVFESYFDFAKEELTTGVCGLDSLNQSHCQFSVTFHREEFLWIEKFCSHLEECLLQMQTKDNWTDFIQSYDYNEKIHLCTYHLISAYLDCTDIKKHGSLFRKKYFIEF